ncbi:GFA family protein [Ruficoccus amylovorans]|uniref:GFA family protein n=1 Tax=Ruficoccus amylovorans TaxID=1804625 RepID=A0A842HIN9_9BACT|nr:GFA family protein [Ruficoccus amylovorans]MBC2595071.1 GFA family protein [Ruficoccus amylovorans]
MKHYGSCLCGEVTYEIEGDFGHFFLCHCDRCRKDTGSAHAANLFAWQAGMKWLTGETRVKTFHLPGTRHMKSFCSDCGSALPCLQEDGALLVVPAGSLDTDVPLRPDAHICMADRANWDEALEKVRMLDGLPEG